MTVTAAFVVDASPLWRAGLVDLLQAQPEVTVVGSAGEVKDLERSNVVDLVVIHLAGEPPVAWGRALHDAQRRSPAARLIGIHDGLSSTDLAELTGDTGASFVDEGSDEDALVRALADPGHRTRQRWEAPTMGPVPLKERESAILSRVAAGMTSAEVAADLGLGVRTVENAKKALFVRLGVLSQAHAVSLAVSLGLLAGHGDGGRRPALLDALARRLIPASDEPITARVVSAETRRVPGEDPPSVLITRKPLPGALVVDVIRSGTLAIVAESQSAADFQFAVAQARLGRSTIADGDLQALLQALRDTVVAVPQITLTGRETDLLTSVAAGESVNQTARSLGIAVKTVENTQRMLFRKLGVRNRSQAIAVATGLGLVGRKQVAPPE